MLFALALVAAALAIFCFVPMGRRSREQPAVLHGRAVSESHGKGALLAGAARVRIPLGEHPVMAGYAGHRRADGPGEPVYARALALQAGDARIYLASIDTLLITGELEEEVLRRAELPPRTCLLLAATHTHSGPGGVWNDTLAGWAGAGAFDSGQRDAIAEAAAQALRQAAADLKSADIAVAREEWPQGPARPRSEGPIDPELVALRLSRAAGPEVATVAIYAMHPTSVPRTERRISPDWPGAAAAGLHEMDPAHGTAPALILQGAVGNTTWDRSSKDLGVRVAAEAARLLALATARPEAELACETRIVALPHAEASRRTPWILRGAQANVFALGLDHFAVQTRLQLGSLALVGVPGEPVGELGLAARPAVLVGLADGYVGYVETPARWRAGLGESARTYFGPSLAHALGLWPR